MMEPPGTPQQMTESGETTVVETKPHISGFIYQPYAASVLQDGLRIDYKSKQIDTQKSFKKTKRKIVMTMTNVKEIL